MKILQFILSLFKRKTELQGTGLLASPTDHRDIALESFRKGFISLPESYRIPYKLKITNQGGSPHCVGHASANLKAEKERREQSFIYFDPDWIYKECKKIDGIPDVAGTYFRAGMKVLKNTGAMPQDSDKNASKYRIGGYTRLKSISFESIKQAIIEYGVLLVGFNGSNEGWKKSNIRKPKFGERRWGHAVALIGWTKNKIILQNSWGEKWGDKGYGYFDRNYLPFEVWACLVDLPNNWEDFLPSKKKPLKHNFKENLWVGMKNDEIEILQNWLKYLGCMNEGIESTGYFGKLTLEAVKVFQGRYKIIPIKGFFGPLTREAFNRISNL